MKIEKSPPLIYQCHCGLVCADVESMRSHQHLHEGDRKNDPVLLYHMTLECKGHGFNSDVCQCKERISYAMTEHVNRQRERDIKAMCSRCNGGRKVVYNERLGEWIHPHAKRGPSRKCDASAIRKAG